MSRFNDDTKMWFEKGEDEESLSSMPAAEQPRATRRPPYLLLGVAAVSLAGACAVYVSLKMSHAPVAPATGPVAIQVEHSVPAQPAAVPEPKATEPAPVEQAAPAAIEAPPSEPEAVPARGKRGLKRPVATPETKSADALLKRGQIREALAAYQKIIEADAGNVLALRGACQALDRLGRVNDAARVCRRALGFAPEDRNTRAVLARVYHSGGAYQWAANEWRQILAQSPKDKEARRGLRLAKAKL